MDLKSVRREQFEELLDEAFTLEIGEESIELRLAEATAMPGESLPGGRQPFSIVLVGIADPILPQGTYTLGHPSIGRAAIFIVPIGPGGDGEMRYEAVFA